MIYRMSHLITVCDLMSTPPFNDVIVQLLFICVCGEIHCQYTNEPQCGSLQGIAADTVKQCDTATYFCQILFIFSKKPVCENLLHIMSLIHTQTFRFLSTSQICCNVLFSQMLLFGPYVMRPSYGACLILYKKARSWH